MEEKLYFHFDDYDTHKIEIILKDNKILLRDTSFEDWENPTVSEKVLKELS